MSLFNALDIVDNHPVMAVSAAIVMKSQLQLLNMDWKDVGFPELRIRTGINTAKCLVGNIGSVQRMQFTALGDGVNIAARLESLNKRYRSSVLIAESTYESVRLEFLCRWMCFAQLKGKKQPINIYEVVCQRDHATDEQKEICGMHELVRQYCQESDFKHARDVCVELLGKQPDNMAIQELLNSLNSKAFNNSIVIELMEK
jgi:hypothetical protein